MDLPRHLAPMDRLGLEVLDPQEAPLDPVTLYHHGAPVVRSLQSSHLAPVDPQPLEDRMRPVVPLGQARPDLPLAPVRHDPLEDPEAQQDLSVWRGLPSTFQNQ